MASDRNLSVGSKLLGGAAAGIARCCERVLETARAGGRKGSLSPNPFEEVLLFGSVSLADAIDWRHSLMSPLESVEVGGRRHSGSVGDSSVAV